MKMMSSRVHTSTKRMSMTVLSLPLLAALLSACGSTPPPPSVPSFPGAEGSTKGIPTSAFTSFERGVAELEKKPANYIDAIKAFDQALAEYEGAKDRQFEARRQHKADLDQHEADLAAWKKLHGEKVKEDPKLQSELAQRSETLAKQRAEIDQGLLAPDYIVARLNLAYTLEKLGRYEDAVKAYRVLLDKGVSEATIRLAYGRSLLLSKRAKDSIKEFEAVLAADDRSLDARNNLAAAYLSLGDLETCLRYVKEVLAVQPKNVSAIINLGLLYLKDQKFDLAELMFMKAIKYDKVNARAYSNLGLTFYQTGRLPQAVVNFKMAIDLEPSMDEARLNLASIYLDYLDYVRALEQFNIVLGRFPQHYQALVGAADSLYGTSKYKEAVNYYLESLKINEKNSEVMLRLAKLYEEKMSEQADHKDVAVLYYERFIALAKPPKTDKIHMQLANLKAIIQMEKTQPPPAATQGDDAEVVEGEGGEPEQADAKDKDPEGAEGNAEDKAAEESDDSGDKAATEPDEG